MSGRCSFHWGQFGDSISCILHFHLPKLSWITSYQVNSRPLTCQFYFDQECIAVSTRLANHHSTTCTEHKVIGLKLKDHSKSGVANLCTRRLRFYKDWMQFVCAYANLLTVVSVYLNEHLTMRSHQRHAPTDCLWTDWQSANWTAEHSEVWIMFDRRMSTSVRQTSVQIKSNNSGGKAQQICWRTTQNTFRFVSSAYIKTLHIWDSYTAVVYYPG